MWILMLVLCVTVTAAADEQAARVTYVAGESIYIDAGSDNGVTEGMEIRIVRDGETVARLAVTYVSAQRSSCKVLEKTGDLQVGDAAMYTVLPRASREAAGSASVRRPSSRRGRPVRGRIGVQFLSVSNRDAGQTDFDQPALSLKLSGHNFGGSGLGMNVDIRARQTNRTLSDGSSDNDSRTRVYRMAVDWSGRDMPVRISVGRQFQPAMASISIFDGVAASWEWQRWSAGVLTGSQPDSVDFGLSSDTKEHGAFVSYRRSGDEGRKLTLTTGLIGSYQESEINREYLYLQTIYSTRKISLYLTEEVDFNRGWKKDLGESSVDSSATFLNMRYRVSDSLSFRAGYDNRKNVRLYRDRETPETEFDDDYRTGIWAGTAYRFLKHYRVGVDFRNSSGGSRGDSDQVTGTFSVYGLTARRICAGVRATHYSNDLLDGDLLSVHGSVNLVDTVRLRVSGGIRDEEDLFSSGPMQQTWYGLDIDWQLGRSWYLLASWNRETGDLEEIDQLYTALSYRF
jgi:hypothetical protein